MPIYISVNLKPALNIIDEANTMSITYLQETHNRNSNDINNPRT